MSDSSYAEMLVMGDSHHNIPSLFDAVYGAGTFSNSKGIVNLQLLLLEYELYATDVPPDGNCGYWVMTKHLHGPTANARKMKSIKSQIKQHIIEACDTLYGKHFFSSLITDGRSIDDYMASFDTTWAESVSFEAAAHLFNVKIVIWSIGQHNNERRLNCQVFPTLSSSQFDTHPRSMKDVHAIHLGSVQFGANRVGDAPTNHYTWIKIFTVIRCRQSV